MDIHNDIRSDADKYIFRCLVLHHRTINLKKGGKRHNVIHSIIKSFLIMHYLAYIQYNLYSYDILVLARLKLGFFERVLIELVFFISVINVFHYLDN